MATQERFLPPRAPAHPSPRALPRGASPAPQRRIRPLDPARPALRMVTIALLAVLVSLLAWGVAFALLV